MSAEINELATALSKAQAQVEGAAKNSANPFFKSKYADLQSVWEACRKPLTDHGLSVLQSPSTEQTAQGLRVSVTTLLLHSSGQWVRDVLSVSAKEDSPQAAGSCISYLKRYALQSFAGVAPEDDDAEAAHGRGVGQAKAAQFPKPAAVAAPDGYKDWLLDMVAVADEGRERLNKEWKTQPQKFRDHLTKHDVATYDSLRAKAVEADKKLVGA